MNMRFSQRIGKKSIRTIFQVDDIDDDLRNRLWNIIYLAFEKISVSYQEYFFRKVWKDFLNLKISDIPTIQGKLSPRKAVEYLGDWFSDAHWFEVYDLIEYLIDGGGFEFRDEFIDDCNKALRLEVSAYRIVDKLVVRVNSEEEIQSIEEAISSTDHYKSVNTHLQAALTFLSDRAEPNYRNSIKESISAVEAFCKIIAEDDKATLGTAIAIIERKHKLHGSLKTAIKSLYGYTSDAGGIRHSLLENDADIDFEDAKFMLVSCTAFINFLKGKVIL